MFVECEVAIPFMHQHMLHVAGVVKLLEQYGMEVIAVRANVKGAQIKVNQPLIPDLIAELAPEIEMLSLAEYQLFGVWVTC